MSVKAIELKRLIVRSRTTDCACKSLISVSLLCVHSSVLSSTDNKNSGKSFSTLNSGSISAMMLVNFPVVKTSRPRVLQFPYFSNQPEAILNVSFSVELQLNFIELKLKFH